jgi:hypothetical protein
VLLNTQCTLVVKSVKVVDVFGAVTTLNHWKLVWLPEKYNAP